LHRVLKGAAQLGVAAAVAAPIGYLSDTPAYRHFEADKALITLSFVHGAEPKGECRRLTQEELQELAPNMRKPMVCSRQRLPVDVELEIDGTLVFADSLRPGGLSGDVPSRVYEKFAVPAGEHRVAVRLRDTARTEGFNYVAKAKVDLAPLHHMVIDFHASTGGFQFKNVTPAGEER